ncbi:MAG: Ribosomal RNA small subunit methyltransferase B [Verrucomicrobia bacterium ADurb.Bin345]|nr:MAG: Ribosomal RNA small subunit methyltransferase B [Verrucomicrobia bacterium ADurb.Bin345]
MIREVQMHARAAQRLAEVALQAVADIEERVATGHSADFALKRFFHHHRELGGRDRRFISNMIFSYFRWKGWTRIAFDNHHPAACLCAWMLDADAPHPAADALAMRLDSALPDVHPAGHEDTGSKLKSFMKWTSGRVEASLLDLAPAWLADELWIPEGVSPAEHSVRCIESFQSRPPTWLRLTTGSEDKVLDELAERGFEVQRHKILQNALSVTSPLQVTSLHSARNGQLEVQDLASQCVGVLCAPKPGESWWDVCAGSGGKALHLADLMTNQGRILGTDIRPGILKQFAHRIRKTRYSCITVRSAPAPADVPTSTFDGVLLDAPCSGTGTWSRNPDARWRTALETIMQRAEKQRMLLNEAAATVKPGGRLVYSVCTITRRETVDVLSDFEAHHPDFKALRTTHPLSGLESDGRVWIWPWEGPCDGMFVAVYVRTTPSQG